VLDAYVQDSVCGTWELMADALVRGGRAALQKRGSALPIKREWARDIAPQLDPSKNVSPSFQAFRTGLLRLLSEESRRA
jgi:hypothetical protein